MPLVEPVPPTLEAAVEHLYSTMTEDDKKYVCEEGMSGLHFTLGMNLRNNWGLWAGGPLKEHFETVYGLGHADDMSGMIFGALEAKCKREPFNANAAAAYYCEYWQKLGIDPLTQKRFDEVGE